MRSDDSPFLQNYAGSDPGCRLGGTRFPRLASLLLVAAAAASAVGCRSGWTGGELPSLLSRDASGPPMQWEPDDAGQTAEPSNGEDD